MAEDLGFPTRPDNVAARLRGLDWAATPLGPPDGWPARLRAVVDLMLASPLVSSVAVGPARVLLYNDAAARLYGPRHPGALGRPLAETWPEAYAGVAHLYDRAFAGEAVHLPAQPLDVSPAGGEVFEATLVPVRDDTGWVLAVHMTGFEVGARLRAEAALRASQERQAFLLKLSDALRPLGDPAEVQEAAMAVLGRHLGASRACYVEVLPDGDAVAPGPGYADGVPDLAGRQWLSDFGDGVPGDFRAGRPLVFADAQAEDRFDGAQRAACAAIQMRAGIGMPILKDGRLVAAIGVHQSAPRAWAPEEVALVGEVAQRTWEAAERARATAALRDGERRFRTLFEALDEAVIILEQLPRDAEGRRDYRYAMLNRAARAAFGLGEDAAGQSTRARRPLADEAWYEVFDRVLATGEPQRLERRSATMGRVFEAYLAPIGEPGERRLLTVTRDVTVRREAEAALREANAGLERRDSHRSAELRLLASIVETTDAFIMVMDTGFVLLGVNRAAASETERIFGVRPKVGDRLLDLLAHLPEHREQVRATWARALSGEAFTVVAEFGDPARARRSYEMKFEALRDRDGRVTGAFQIAADVTDRLAAEARLAEAEAQLRQAQKMEAIGQLTGGVAHDFNNLLTPIVGALDVLGRRALGGAREQRLIEGAAQSAERARVLVSRLLAFARRQPLRTGAVDLVGLVAGLRNLVVSTMGPKVRLEVSVAPGLPPATADANQLEMAVLNLAVNARDAMPEGGLLTIAADVEEVGPGHPRRLPPGSYLRLCVTDTGTGMDAATLARAVEPFFSTKGVGRGTGLGLSMVHGLASQLGGTLHIESTLGRGTRVTLWLPAAPEGEARPQPPEPELRALAARVLLVDDEALVREAAADMLLDLGYGVTMAASAEEALGLVADGLSPDLLVTDHLMPGMTGTDLALRLRRDRPSLPVLVVSGYAEAEGLSPDLPRLAKPFRRDELAASLDAILPAP